MDEQKPISFNPFSISLKGVNIIEASAGTGKTYGIASIYTRLIILKNKHIENILVVTFTNAAVAELKNRLRNRLDSVLVFLKTYFETSDKSNPQELFLLDLLAEIQLHGLEIPKVIEHLKRQLIHFDEAAVYTIHSFCLTVLKNEAFLSGTPFNINLIPNHHTQINTLIEDFFREKIASDIHYSKLFFLEKIIPNSIDAEIKKWLQKPLLKKNFSSDLENKFKQIFSQLNELMIHISKEFNYQAKDELLSIIAEKKILNGNFFREKTYQKTFEIFKKSPEEILNYLDNQTIFNACKRLKFQENFIKKKLQQDTSTVQLIKNLFHSFKSIVLLAETYEEFNKNKIKYLSNLKLQLINYVDAKLQDYKKITIERSFDDLLVDVLTILKNKTLQTQKLIENLTSNYHYVLIDEFQDTDPIQYSIFKLLFIEYSIPVFFVGDPKQSIYEFRGADISAYLEAQKNADHFYHMDTNYRSVDGLIQSINALFTHSQNPFKNKEISYQPVKADRKIPKLQEPTNSHYPFTIIKLNDDNKNKNELNKIAAKACANLIAAMLEKTQQGSIKYENRTLEANDIAILVTTHFQAELMAEALTAKKIRSVKLEKESIFKTHEAITLLSLLKLWYKALYAVENNETISLIDDDLNYLFASELFNFTAEKIQIIQTQELENHYYFKLCHQCAKLWEKKGIYTAFIFFIKIIEFEKKQIQYQQERVLTNFNQLIELLAQQEIFNKNPYKLLKWLEEQIQSENLPSDENTLRLESDENLIKIVTIHASKGLQYPIVFCPFIWNYSNKKFKQTQSELKVQFNPDTLERELIFSDHHEPSCVEDEESIRKLYVALTRAEEKLILLIENTDNINSNNPIHYLLAHSTHNSHACSNNTWQLWKKWLQIHPELQNFVLLQETLPVDADFHPLKTENISWKKIQSPTFKISVSEQTSYSQLISQLKKKTTKDNTIENGDSESTTLTFNEPLNTFNFPKGPMVGNCWHEILESIDFQKPLMQQENLIKEKMIQYSLPALLKENQTLQNLVDITTQIIQHVVHINLDEHQTKLVHFPKNKIKKEFGFTLYCKQQFDLNKINSWLTQINRSDLKIDLNNQKNTCQIYETYLNGFIDLIALSSKNEVYIIDYKSNFLGNQIEDYQPPQLINQILKHHYQIQAIIYALAIYRYFNPNQFSINSFKIRYLFLRGLNKDQNNGLWKWNLAARELEELEKYLN